jgi:hypothetical protein
VYPLPASPDCSVYLTCCSGLGFQRQCKDWGQVYVVRASCRLITSRANSLGSSLPWSPSSLQDYTPTKGIGVFDARTSACLTLAEAGNNTDLCRWEGRTHCVRMAPPGTACT